MGSFGDLGYYDLNGPERLAKLARSINQMPMITGNPAGRRRSGSIPARSSPADLYETNQRAAGPEGVETTRGFIGNMVTKAIRRRTRPGSSSAT